MNMECILVRSKKSEWVISTWHWKKISGRYKLKSGKTFRVLHNSLFLFYLQQPIRNELTKKISSVTESVANTNIFFFCTDFLSRTFSESKSRTLSLQVTENASVFRFILLSPFSLNFSLHDESVNQLTSNFRFVCVVSEIDRTSFPRVLCYRRWAWR